jgi:hypothetical protein
VRAACPAVLALVLAVAVTPASAQVDPDPLIAPVVFHWSQVQTAWPTLEGGSAGDASQAFWARQIQLLESSGFTAELFDVAYGSELSQRNHLAALRQRRAAAPNGPLPPRIAPFFAAETFVEYSTPKDALSPTGFEKFYQALRGFFLMYAEYFPPKAGQKGLLDPELLAKVDGRIFVVLWWVPLQSYNLPSTFFSALSDRLERDFGFRAYWSVHEWLAGGGPDDVNFLFNGSARLQRSPSTTHPAVDLLVAFWPPNLDTYTSDLFAPRDGGTAYAAAWDVVIAGNPRPSIVLVESYNEISEGSHLMPSWPVSHYPGDSHWTGTPDDGHCATQPCHPVSFTDAWGSENPWHYLDLTQRKIREWREGPAPAGADIIRPHALILAPRTDEVVSGATPLRIVAADDKAVREVRVYLDGFLLLTGTGSIDRRLKSSFLADGTHALAVTVVDQAGNTDITTSTFIVQNAIASSNRERASSIDTRR